MDTLGIATGHLLRKDGRMANQRSVGMRSLGQRPSLISAFPSPK